MMMILGATTVQLLLKSNAVIEIESTTESMSYPVPSVPCAQGIFNSLSLTQTYLQRNFLRDCNCVALTTDCIAMKNCYADPNDFSITLGIYSPC